MNLILDRYIARTVLMSTGMVVIVFSALMFLMLFIGEVDDIGKGSYDLARVMAFSIMKLPTRIYYVWPVIALLGALFALGGLAADSELIVIRSAGVSMSRLAVSVGLAGLLLSVLAVLLGEVIVPVGTQKAEQVRDHAIHGDTSHASGGGLWMRNSGYVLYMDRVLPGGRIRGLRVYRVNDDRRLSLAGSARKASVDGHELRIEKARLTHFDGVHARTESPDKATLDVRIKPRDLELAVTQPDELSSAGLWKFIDYLDTHDIDAGDYQLSLWRNITTPFTVWVLTIFALPFAFGSLRSASAGQRLFMGGLVGLLFFLVNEIMASTGPVYGLPPWLAASMPTLLLAVGGGYWMRRLD